MRIVFLLVAVITIGGCATQNVTPVESESEITKVYIQYDDEVHKKEINEELVWQFENLGFKAELYHGDMPKDAAHTFLYKAKWGWNFVSFLQYFQGTLYENGRIIGEVEFEEKMGGGKLTKFAEPREKLEPLMSELLQNIRKD